jgi:predicted amidohydrolase
MYLCLMQEKQNELYDFRGSGQSFPFARAERLQREMIAQNLALMEEGAEKGEFLVSSEAINFSGLPERLAFSAWDLVNHGYERLCKTLREFAARKKRWLAVGVYRPAPGGVLYNSALLINRRGDLAAVCDKIHLAGTEQTYLAAGGAFCCFDSEFGKIGVCICWDLQFPETARILALRGARIILCPSWGWEAVYAKSRAYENGVFVAGAMAVPHKGSIAGIRSPSSVIDPEGGVVAAGGAERAELIGCEIDLSREWDMRAVRMADRRPELYGELIERRAPCPAGPLVRACPGKFTAAENGVPRFSDRDMDPAGTRHFLSNEDTGKHACFDLAPGAFIHRGGA